MPATITDSRIFSGSNTSISGTGPNATGVNRIGYLYIGQGTGGDDAVSSVTWGGQSMSRLADIFSVSQGSAMYIYRLAGIVTGSQTIAFTGTSGRTYNCIAIAVQDAQQTGSEMTIDEFDNYDTNQNNGFNNVGILSKVGELVLDFIHIAQGSAFTHSPKVPQFSLHELITVNSRNTWASYMFADVNLESMGWDWGAGDFVALGHMAFTVLGTGTSGVSNSGLISANSDILKLFGGSLSQTRSLSISGSGDLILNTTGSGLIYTFPSSSTVLVGTDTTQSLTNKSGSFIQIQIPASGSAPVFTPTQASDRVTLFYNTGSNFLYAYSKGAWVSKSFV